LVKKLAARSVDIAVLESDTLRQVLAPGDGYDERGRDAFYTAVVWVGEVLTRHGVPVIFDATATRRVYRGRAREQISSFIEVHVDCPIEVCIERDPKGIYRKGLEGKSDWVPGLQSAYEAPVSPDLVVSGTGEDPDLAADRILAEIVDRGYIA
jgi:adenylylsulfate kinase